MKKLTPIFITKEENLMKYHEWVKSVLLQEISLMAQNPWLFAVNPDSDFTRKRKLDFENLLRFLISKESDNTANELLKYFDYGIDTVSNSAFYQQRKKLLPETLPYLLHSFNSHFPLYLFRGVYNLVAADGCNFNIFRNPDDKDTFHPQSNGVSQRGYNSIIVVALYDILSKRYLDCVVQKGRLKNEFRAICDLADRYPYGGNPIFIGDRGFASYNFYAHAKEKGFLFMVRAKDIFINRLLNINDLPDDIDINVDIILSRSQSKKKMMRPDLAEQYRHVCQNVVFDFIEPGSEDEYHLRLRVVRAKIAEGIFVNVITNLPADEFSVDDIKHLYHLRWPIETSFRDLKHIIGATEFISKKVPYIEQEVWARLILFDFCSIITMHVVIEQNDTKHIYQVNFSMAMKICHNFFRIRDLYNPPDLERLIGRYSLPIRLGRNFTRQHRFQTPFSFCYRR
jgi:hypothetical protein